MITHLRNICIGAMVLAVASAQAIVIDDFTSGAYDINVNSANPVREAVRAGTMLGGERDALLQWSGGPDGTQVRANVVVSGGGLQFFSADSQASGMLILQYDGFDGEAEDGVLNTGGALGGDFTGQNAFVLDYRFVDGGAASFVTVQIRVIASNGEFISAPQVVPAINGFHACVIPFATVGVFDVSDVRLVEFRFMSEQSADFTLMNIHTIPGPAAAIPFALGLLGAARRRRRS